MTEATLFHRCRKALGLSQPAIARALLIASDRTIRRWEQNELAVAGPAWVALEMMLRARGETALAVRVAAVIEQRRQISPSAWGVMSAGRVPARDSWARRPIYNSFYFSNPCQRWQYDVTIIRFVFA